LGVVFAVLIVVAVIIFVSLGQWAGRLARKWDHPRAGSALAVVAERWSGRRNRKISVFGTRGDARCPAWVASLV